VAATGGAEAGDGDLDSEAGIVCRNVGLEGALCTVELGSG